MSDLVAVVLPAAYVVLAVLAARAVVRATAHRARHRLGPGRPVGTAAVTVRERPQVARSAHAR